MNRAQRLVVWVGALALLAMCVYPPHVRGKRPEYDWLWEFGSIDTARLGLQCLLVAGVTGLLAYGLRPAAIQALAKRKKLAIQSAVALLAVVVVVVTVGTGLYAVCGVWEALHWWWDSLPPEQVSKISVVAPEWEPPGLSTSSALSPVSNPQVQSPPAPPPGFVLDTPTRPVFTPKVQAPAAKPQGDIFDQIEAEEKRTQPKFLTDEEFLGLPPQQQRLLVKNGSVEALRAISIRIYYYPDAPVPLTYDRLPCFVSPGGQADVTVFIAHDYTLPLRVEVVGAWRQ